MTKISRRKILKGSAVAAAGVGLSPLLRPTRAAAAETVKVGILHSLTGTIAIAEASVVDAEKLAIEEINAAGGVMGRKIEAIIEDGASDWPTFAEKARKLLERDKVACDLRLLHVGVAQGGAAGDGEEQGPPLLPDVLRGARAVAQHHVHGAGGDAVGDRRRRLAGQEQGQELLPDRLRLHLAAHDQQDRQADDREGGRQGGGRGLLPARSHRVLVGDQQDQGVQGGRHPQHRRRRAATSRSTSSSRRPASPARPRRCWRSRSPRRSCPASGPRTRRGSSPAWATSRASRTRPTRSSSRRSRPSTAPSACSATRSTAATPRSTCGSWPPRRPAASRCPRWSRRRRSWRGTRRRARSSSTSPTTTCGSTPASASSSKDGQVKILYESKLIEPNPFPKLL